ncbi:Uncharacterized protein FWK35_00035323, partial [Aphis craccivora]
TILELHGAISDVGDADINAAEFYNSERSDVCIDFNFGDGFQWQSEYPWYIIEVKSKHFPTVFKQIEKNKKKVTEKLEFLRK